MWKKNELGWIGVDPGVGGVKVAQLLREGNTLRLVASAVAAWDARTTAPHSGNRKSGSEGDLLALRAALASANVQYAEVAASLSMRHCEAIGAQDEPQGRTFDRWRVSAPGDPAEQWLGLSVDTDIAMALCDALDKTSLRCRQIDSAPHALARAVQWLQSDKTHKMSAALDWGASGATFCLVRNGVPHYIRRLKDCALGPIEAAFCDQLGGSPEEFRQLMAQVGVQPSAESPEDADTATLLAEHLEPALEQLCSELTKTLAYVRSRRGGAVDHVYLFGGGGMIRGVDAEIARRTGAAIQVWKLRQQDGSGAQPDCLVAQAMALSALAWEAP